MGTWAASVSGLLSKLSAVGNAQVPGSFPVKEFMGEGARCASAEDVIAVYLVS